MEFLCGLPSLPEQAMQRPCAGAGTGCNEMSLHDWPYQMTNNFMRAMRLSRPD
jgi:hypothetical protein